MPVTTGSAPEEHEESPSAGSRKNDGTPTDILLDQLRESPDALADLANRYHGNGVVGAVICDGGHLMEPFIVNGTQWGWGCWDLSHDAERLKPDELTLAHCPRSDIDYCGPPAPEHKQPARFCRVENTSTGYVLAYMEGNDRQLLGNPEYGHTHLQQWSPNDFANPALDQSIEVVYTEPVKQADASAERKTTA